MLFFNNYDMAGVRDAYQRGVLPGHHLWGTAHLAETCDVVDLVRSNEGARHGMVAKVEHHLGERLGDIDLEHQAWSRADAHAVAYAGNSDTSRLLALARRAKLFRHPLTAVCHRIPASRNERLLSAYRGYDHLISLSNYATDRLQELGVAPERISTLLWGADLSFPGFNSIDPPRPDAPVVSTGKSLRDIRTLIEALAKTSSPAVVYGQGAALAGLDVPASTELVSTKRPYLEILGDFRSASVVAIPLQVTSPTSGHTGLTELAEALACGKPVIATRTNYLDIDIEEIGCGWWVDKRDVGGWVERIEAALSDRDRLAEMGARGRAWAEKHADYMHFERGVQQMIATVAA